jgi:hypothetical protein
MAIKKFSTEVVLNAKGKPTETRSILAANEVVTIDGDKDKVEVKLVDAIVDFVTSAAQEKAYKEKKDNAAGVIRTFISDVRKFFSKDKEPTKTYRILGNETKVMKYAVDVSSSGKFSYSSKDEDLKALKKDLTAGVFNQIFEENAVISIKKTITDDDKKRRELTKLLLDTLGEEKLKEYFERDVTYVLKASELPTLIKGFPAATQKIITANIVPTADAVKDVSTVVSN